MFSKQVNYKTTISIVKCMVLKYPVFPKMPQLKRLKNLT